MRENGSRRKRKFIPTTASNRKFEVSENILNRPFHAERGGEKWVLSYQGYAIPGYH
jgi:hypothetical protein